MIGPMFCWFQPLQARTSDDKKHDRQPTTAVDRCWSRRQYQYGIRRSRSDQSTSHFSFYWKRPTIVCPKFFRPATTYLTIWIQNWQRCELSALHTAWRNRCFNLGKEIEVGDGNNRKTGILIGFGSAGQLRLQEDNGQQTEIWAGDSRN